MSTVNNTSPVHRRKSNISSTSSKSEDSIPSLRSQKIITSRSPKDPSPIYQEDITLPKPQITGWTIFDYTLAILRSDIFLNGLAFLGALLVVYLTWYKFFTEVIVWIPNFPGNEGISVFDPLGETNTRAVDSKVSKSGRDQVNRGVRHYPEIIGVQTLSSPLEGLAMLHEVHTFDSLQAAYSDIPYVMNNLIQSVPDLSADSLALNKKLKGFRNHAWALSKDIGDYRKLFDPLIRILKDESNLLKTALSKVKLKDKWKDPLDLNSKEGKEITEIWFNHYEQLKKEMRYLWERTHTFQQSAIVGAIKEREALARALKGAESRMTKEAKARNWDNFDFHQANKLLERLRSGSANDPQGYELQLSLASKQIEKMVKQRVGAIENATEMLQLWKSQEPISPTDHGPVLIKLPPLKEQINEVVRVSREIDKVKACIDEQVDDLWKKLKGKERGSRQRMEAYDYVLGGNARKDKLRKKGMSS
ncbi:hypothetical protein SBOR_8641 [Sclerotinia borealis F-4128]|uniref:Uncharacterized protein n=1 Tax=Sclerotinia borealis (strain F-4128) TaxID=1432307 RepID=W9C5H5_SCLBF|nr:hypothetical protein SBOR_8641 [Sclerotinia borealis F-4128]